MKILFLTPYPSGEAPSQRFRFEQYLELLEKEGYEVECQSFLDEASWKILYKNGYVFRKIINTLKGFGRRLLMLPKARQFDRVFIHREAAPLGPPVFEWVLTKVLRKKIIYDFDDAIWLPNTSAQNRLAAGLKWHHKVKAICRWSHTISVGNAYLADFARQFNANVQYNPTTIDTENLHNELKDQDTQKPVIGWTGTHSTISYLHELVPVLKKLENRYAFEFCVISNKEPEFQLDSLVYKPWSKSTEREDLLRFNIGLMPLSDDAWAKGKCGFKALQYMALGIPPVISPVGVNNQIVSHGENGYLCKSPEEWHEVLEQLLKNHENRQKMGLRCRQTIIDRYSVLSNGQNFLALFKD